jgi:hypothetical protein
LNSNISFQFVGSIINGCIVGFEINLLNQKSKAENIN